MNTDRFLAPAPIVIPPGASLLQRLRLRFGRFGPPLHHVHRRLWERMH